MVFETKEIKSESPLGFPENAKRYWRHLVPITLFPLFAILLLRWKAEGWTEWVIIISFIPAAFYAGIPTHTRKAKHSFWLLALGLYMTGGLLAVVSIMVVEGMVGALTR
jgi:hypothetical protein